MPGFQTVEATLSPRRGGIVQLRVLTLDWKVSQAAGSHTGLKPRAGCVRPLRDENPQFSASLRRGMLDTLIQNATVFDGVDHD